MSAMRMRGVVAYLVVASCGCGLVAGSAIPMWEFLSRGEKMSHLFNMFVKQVEDHCDQSTMPDCNKVLMVYGLTNLAKMDDDSLDKMDPYQRGAQDIIWDSMMKGSYKSPSSSPSPSPAGSSGSSSSSSSSRRTEAQDIYAADEDGDLADGGGNGLGGATARDQDDVGRYAIGHGAMVVRLMPDGSPVPGDAERPLPRDEDAEEFRLMRGQPMPSLEELQRASARPSSQQQQQQQHRPRGPANPDHERYQPNPLPGPGHYSSRFPLLTASQPHAKFALPPPGINFRIAGRSHQQ